MTPAHRAATAATLALTAAALAGPLAPPPGPVAPTMKTLDQIEPRTPITPATTPGDADASPSHFKITQPGSYYLVANVAVPPGRHGIEIACSDVTIDLNGFTLTGANEASFAGISHALPQLRNIEVRNGGIRNFGRAGVDLSDFDDWARPRVGRIEKLRLFQCGAGIMPGGEFTVADCVISGGSGGITGRGELLIERWQVTNTTGHGILSITQATTVRDCRVESAQGPGIMISQGLVSGCEVHSAGEDGIRVAGAGQVRSCEVRNAGEDGIDVGSASLVQDNNVSNVGNAGIRVGAKSRVADNMIGPSFYPSAQITHTGISLDGGSTHVEGNTVVGADRGVYAAVGGNNIFRNVFMETTTSIIQIGSNTYGPIVTTTGAVQSTVPTANFKN